MPLPLLLPSSIAAISFTWQPAKQLREASPSPEAVLICRSYGGLLWAVNLLCLQFLVQRGDVCDDVGGMLAVSLAFYHIFPIARAGARIWSRAHQPQRQGDALGGPAVHLAVHTILFLTLSWGRMRCK